MQVISRTFISTMFVKLIDSFFFSLKVLISESIKKKNFFFTLKLLHNCFAQHCLIELVTFNINAIIVTTRSRHSSSSKSISSSGSGSSCYCNLCNKQQTLQSNEIIKWLVICKCFDRFKCHKNFEKKGLQSFFFFFQTQFKFCFLQL